MNIAIFRRNFGNYSETFVKENVHNLNNGNTVVICHEIVNKCKWHENRPILILEKYPVFLRTLILFIFLKRHNVKGCVIEFMDYAIKYREVFEKIKMPYVVLGHGYDIGRSLKKFKSYANDIEKLKTAQKVVVPCQYAKDVITKRTKLNKDKIHVVPVGIDLKKFESQNTTKDAKKAVYVGRFVEKKFPISMLYAFYLARIKEPEIKLVCIGDGPLMPAAKDFCRIFNLQDSVDFKGSQKPKVVKNEIDSARLLIQHSATASNGDMETMPLSVQEALALGTPAVVTDHAGLPEIVDDGVNGFIVKEHDIESLSQNILKIFRMNDAEYLKLQQGCLKKRAYFSSDRRRKYISELFK